MEIDADVEFQRRVWIAQRLGWIVIGIIIVAALLGVFGNGPFSKAIAVAAGVRVEYERFARLQQPTQVRLMLEPGQKAQVEVSRKYLDSVQIEQITPEPSAVESAGDWLIYRFSGAAPQTVTFHLEPQEFGSLAGSARVSGGSPAAFRQFVYP